MAELAPRTALHRAGPSIQTLGALEIRDDPDLAIAWIARRREGDLAPAEAFLGLTLPPAGEMAAAGGHRAVAVGREQWLVLAPHAMDFADRIRAAGGAGVSVCDQSDGWAVFEIRGPVAPLLERLCDIDPATLGPGRSAPTGIEQMRCILLAGAQGLTLLGPRSSAGSLHHAILSAARCIA